MKHIQIPTKGVYRHMYCNHKECRCDRVHLIIFSKCVGDTVYFGKLCMDCWLRSERLKALPQLGIEYENPAEWTFTDVKTWNDLITWSKDP